MNITITPDLELLVNEKIASGLYHSASEVVHAGLRLLKEQDELKQLRLQELKREIAVGLRQLDEGKGQPLDLQAIAAIKINGRAVSPRTLTEWYGRLEDAEPFPEIRYWQAQSDAAKFAAVWEMVLEAHQLKGEDLSESRLQRTIGGLQRRAG